MSEKISALMSPKTAMKALGNAAGLRPGTAVFIGHPAGLGESIDAELFDVAREGPACTLTYGTELERIG